jgi:dihydrodipicolinate reductase
MGKVLEFPSQQAQGLAYLDAQLRKLLTSKGADQQLIDFAADQLTQTYTQLSTSEQYSFRIQLPAGLDDEESEALNRQINAGLEGIRSENHSLMIKLVAQLVLAKVQLFQHARD